MLREFKSLISLLKILSISLVFLFFCPVGLLVAGSSLSVIQAQLGFDFINNPFLFQLVWSTVNIILLFLTWPKSVSNSKVMICERLSWLQIIYLGCGLLYYGTSYTPTEGLNRYIFLFLFSMISFCLEAYLYLKAKVLIKRAQS